MEDLLNEYGLEYPSQYYDLIIGSYINGQKKQCLDQLKAMPIQQRRNFVSYISAEDTGAPQTMFTFILDALI